MSTETAGTGMYMQVSGLHTIASRLEETAGVLHGHADAIAGVTIPMSAFGVNTAAGAQHEQSRQTLASTIRSHAATVTGHGAHVRNAASTQAAGDESDGLALSAFGRKV